MKRIFLLGTLAVGLASCSRKVSEGMNAADGGVASEVFEVVQRANASRCELEQVSGKLSLELAMGAQDVKVSGDLKMKRNSLIQITLQALGLITVGRMEFTPEYMMVMDNMNKRYVRVAYEDVEFLQDNRIDFYTFQALLWNELFTPGGKDSAPAASAFEPEVQGGDVLLHHSNRQLVLSFLVGAATGQLRQSTVVGALHKRGLECEYQNWATLGDKSFPSKLRVTVKTGGQDVEASLSLSRLKEETSWKGAPTQVDEKKFQQLTLQQVWSAVMSLAK